MTIKLSHDDIKGCFWNIFGVDEFLVLIVNHAGDTKYRYIVKSRSNLLHNIKWNGRNYPLDQNVSNKQTAIDDLCNCATHIGNAITNNPQRV